MGLDTVSEKQFLVGFDGFVDAIIHPVDKRLSSKEYKRLPTITSFANRIEQAAGKSTNIELFCLMEKIGGNGPLMAQGLSGLGADVSCLGLLGYPEVLPVFEPLKQSMKLYSIGNPGYTNALEFTDGKIMLSRPESLKEMNWQRLVDIIGEKKIAELLTQSDLVACTNWTQLTELSGVYTHLLKMLPDLETKTKFFFDLADPQKRPPEMIAEVLGQIQSFNSFGGSILGLNLKEAEQVAKILGLPHSFSESEESLQEAVTQIGGALKISGVVIHALKYAAATLNGTTAVVQGPYCAEPKLTTGAGDHFNAGFCAGTLAGVSVADALYLGVCTSGMYVRKPGSPTKEETIGLMKSWLEGALSE